MSGVYGHNHASIYTRNSEKSLAFYRDVLGMDEMAEFGPLDMPGMPYTHIMILQAPNGSTLEMVQIKNPYRQPLPIGKGVVTGFQELVFEVEDLEGFVEEAQAKDVRFEGPVTRVGDVKQVCCKGPDHERVRFVERV